VRQLRHIASPQRSIQQQGESAYLSRALSIALIALT
jgi:hypothetical protein